MDVTLQQIEKSIGKKFKDSEIRSSKEVNIWLKIDGRKILRVTYSKGRGTIPKGTLRQIQNQLQLDRTQFINFVYCPMEAEEYEKIIRNKNLV